MPVLVDPMRLQQMATEQIFTAIEPQRTPPETPRNLIATARNFGILVQWGRVDDADGYVVMVADDQDFSQPMLQRKLPGEDTLEWFYNTGNAALTRYFRVQSYRGDSYSQPSAAVNATSTSSEPKSDSSTPANATFTNSETTLATVTLTTTGRTVLIVGRATLRDDTDANLVTVRIKEDGNIIDAVRGVALVTGSSTYGYQLTAFNFSTPAAGAHTYTLTAQNDSNAQTCNANSLKLIVAEMAFLTPAEANPAPPDPPSPPQSPPQPESFPTGAGAPYGRY